MTVGLVVMAAALAALVARECRGRPAGAGDIALRVLGGVGLLTLAVASLAADAPAGAAVGVGTALALVVAPVAARGLRSARGALTPLSPSRTTGGS